MKYRSEAVNPRIPCLLTHISCVKPKGKYVPETILEFHIPARS
jgi:hypothetical protein